MEGTKPGEVAKIAEVPKSPMATVKTPLKQGTAIDLSSFVVCDDEEQTYHYQEDIPVSSTPLKKSLAEKSLADNYQEDVQMSFRQKQLAALQERSFGNSVIQQSLTNSMFQSYQPSYQNSVMQNTQSMQYSQSIQKSQNQSMQYTRSIQNTQSQSMQNTGSTQTNRSILGTRSMIQNGSASRSMGNTQSSIYPQYGSLSTEHVRRTTGTSKRRNWMDSIRSMRHASISISMLAKPSDDRNANSVITGWNVSNLIQGTTILGIPYAVQQGGWAAVLMIFFLGFLTCYTGRILVDCMYETSKKTNIKRRLRIDYPEIAQAAMGKKGYIAMNIIQNSVMFGGSVMYIIILGTVWSNVFPELGLQEWAAINCLVTLPSLFITKMSIVSWFSMVSVFSIMACFVVLLIYCFTQIPLWDIANIPPFDIETFPIGFGIIMFSYCAHAVLPSIEGSMKKPRAYNTMINTSFSIASISKAALGVFMVLRFGSNTAEVATVNLEEDVTFSKIASFLVIFNVLLAMPLEMFVVSASYDEAMLKYFPYIDKRSGYHWVWLLISRPLLLTFTLLVAVTVPHFGLLMGMVGSLSGTALCFLFPCYCHLKLRWDSLTKRQVAFDVFIIIFGFFAGGLGLVFSVKGLIYS